MTPLRTARNVITDPRTLGVARAAPRTAAFLAKSWAAEGGVNRPTVGFAAQVLLDEVIIAAMKDPRLLPHREDYLRAGADMAAAHDLWSERGWLDKPEGYHRDPSVPSGAVLTRERALNIGYEHLTFPSGYEPHPGEPGRDRWLGHEANRTVHAWV